MQFWKDSNAPVEVAFNRTPTPLLGLCISLGCFQPDSATKLLILSQQFSFSITGNKSTLKSLRKLEMKELLGKVVKNVYANADKTLICFRTANEDLIYAAEGDCCSNSWIEHISGLDALKDAKILEVEEIDMSHLNKRDDEVHDYLQVYGWKFKTKKGYCDLDFRNSSNGYYGGYMTFMRHLKYKFTDSKELKHDF